METVALGYGLVCIAVVAFTLRLELRQRRLEQKYDELHAAVNAADHMDTSQSVARAA